jgi:hypothetical protein
MYVYCTRVYSIWRPMYSVEKYSVLGTNSLAVFTAVTNNWINLRPSLLQGHRHRQTRGQADNRTERQEDRQTEATEKPFDG